MAAEYGDLIQAIVTVIIVIGSFVLTYTLWRN
jgi:hypothetical protein